MKGQEGDLQQPLVDDLDCASDDWGLPDRRNPARNTKGFSVVLTITRAVSLLVVLTAAIIVSIWVGTMMPAARVDLDRRCAEHTGQWSPVIRDVPIFYTPTAFNGSFMAENIYRQPGSDEVDQAWEALGVDYRAGVISYEDGLASGLDLSFVQRSKRFGGGFLVNVEGMHHLHCLNLLRKSLYFNYDRYKALGQHAFKNDDDILQLHVTHCLDTIRQVLMCNVDTAVLGQVWTAGSDKPTAFPDFNTQHVCKNFDDVRKWAEKIQAPPRNEVARDYLAAPAPEHILSSVP